MDPHYVGSMKLARSIPLFCPLLFVFACAQAKPASGPERTSGPPPQEDASSSPSGDAKADADEPGAGGDSEEQVAKEKSKDADTAPPPPADAAPQAARVEKPLSGALTQDDIRNIMMKNGALLDACYKLGDKSKPLVGTVKVQATIGPSGKVNEVKVLKSTMKNPKVDTCVADAFQKIKFPPPSTGATSVITFPINFEGVEMVQK